MKTLLTLLLISVCSITFGQPSQKQKEASTEISCTGCGLIAIDQGILKKIPLSKGELLTIQQHEDDIKRNGPAIKAFFKRDSVYQNQFLPNTITPYINQGDTLESWNKVGNEIHLKFKPKKK